jgi:Na+-driven multidrug efflux pump
MATVTTTVGFLVGTFAPRWAVSIFAEEPVMIDIAAKGFKIVVTAFPIVGFQIVVSNFFQSIDMANKAIFLSLSRQVLFLIPCLIVVPGYFGIKGVWMAMPISDAIATLIAAVLMVGLVRKFKKSPSEIGFKGVE